MSVKYLLPVMASLILVTGGCSSKDVFVLVADADGKVGEITVETQGGKQVLSEAGSSTVVAAADKAPATPKIMSQDEINKTFAQAIAARPLPASKYILQFKTGTSELTKESMELLQKVLAEVKERMPCDVRVVGHTDTKGDDESNNRLSLERANLVQKELVKIGLDPKLIEVASHGEKDLLVPTNNDVDEPRNRRVEVFVR